MADEVVDLLDLDPAWVRSDEFAQVFGGNQLLAGMDPFAMAYGGHQFGHWAGQLGDGRAINLGELTGTDGRSYALQLKGAGPTPYSRRADGRAVLRSSVREFLCSEAMFHLGVPTTRALSLVATGDDVVRDMFYDGRPAAEPGAVVCRVAPSFVRFGSFELPSSRGDVDLLRSLTDFVLIHHFPDLGDPGTEAYIELYHEVCRRTAALMVHWQRVGFVHGVMNTDNLSILGQTIDYGPYGWLENFDPTWTPNTTDAANRRYRYGHQPSVAGWNLARLAEALHPLIGAIEPLQAGLDLYAADYAAGWSEAVHAKLGLIADGDADTTAVVEGVWTALTTAEIDMTLFFRGLADAETTAGVARSASDPWLLPALYRPETDRPAGDVTDWVDGWSAVVRRQGLDRDTRRASMNAVNPRYVLRNYLAQLAIDAAAEGDTQVLDDLADTLRRPYDFQPEREHFAERRPDWARNRPGCSMLSCSS